MTARRVRSDLSFGPERRVKRRREFLQIQGSGRKYRSPHFLLIAVATEKLSTETSRSERTAEEGQSLAESRLGVTITTKVHKRAVRRNKLRRRIREIFRHQRLSFRSAYDLVVIALTGSTDLEFPQIEEELCSLLKKANILARSGR
jgi:ribonuclease P protein component